MTPWTIAFQAPLSMGFSRHEYWSGFLLPFSRGSSQPRNQTQVSCIAGRFFTIWATREAQILPKAPKYFQSKSGFWALNSSIQLPQKKTQRLHPCEICSFSRPILDELHPVTQARSMWFFRVGSLRLKQQELWRSLFTFKFNHLLISLNFNFLIWRDENKKSFLMSPWVKIHLPMQGHGFHPWSKKILHTVNN